MNIERILFTICCLFGSLVQAQGANVPVLRFGYAEACPHMCPNNERKGFTTDIARAIYEDLGYQVEFVALPWARAASNALNGRLNGVLSAGKEETPQMLFPELEIAVQSDCFYGRADDTWQASPEPEAFLGRRTIVFNGWVMDSAYRLALGNERYEQTFEIFSIDERYNQRVVDMLRMKRADAFWMDINVFRYFKRTHPELLADTIKNLGCIKFQNLYLALSPAKPNLSAKLAVEFDNGMIKLRRSGELARILADYGLSDWKTP